MPDEGKVVPDQGVCRVNGQILQTLCHLRFALVVVEEGKGGRCRWEVECVRVPRYVCDDAPTPW